MTEDNIIQVDNIKKSFKEVHALDGISLNVQRGTILGLLGPNGAGKTTLVRVLTTLLKPDSGKATILGLDVAQDARKVRSHIGLAGQYAAVDENLTGKENLELVGRLYHLPLKEVRKRSQNLLERFSLTKAQDRPAKTYSGGMRRRLDLAASLVGQPEILFLDEPTTGLDPKSRTQLWVLIEELVKEGTTILLTTQYLEEADYLADNIVMIDQGRVIAEGTASELKARIHGGVLELTLEQENQVEQAVQLLKKIGSGEPEIELGTHHITIPAKQDIKPVVEAVRLLDKANIAVSDIELRKPTLDEVFLTLTGDKEDHE